MCVTGLLTRWDEQSGWLGKAIIGEQGRRRQGGISDALLHRGRRRRPPLRRAWDEFLKRPAATLWACDFFSAKTWTIQGLVEVFVLFFIHAGSRFVKEFDAILESEGLEVKPVGVPAPNQNAIAERFVQSVRQECLDHFVLCGEAHLRHILDEYLVYYHRSRPHQGLDTVPPDGSVPSSGEEEGSLADVRCEERLGGLLKHYTCAA